MSANAGTFANLPDYLLNLRLCNAPIWLTDGGYHAVGIAFPTEPVFLQSNFGSGVDIRYPVFTAFSEQVDFLGPKINVGFLENHHFRNTASGAVEQFHKGFFPIVLASIPNQFQFDIGQRLTWFGFKFDWIYSAANIFGQILLFSSFMAPTRELLFVVVKFESISAVLKYFHSLQFFVPFFRRIAILSTANVKAIIES